MEQSFRLAELFVTPVGILMFMMIASFIAYVRSYWAGTAILMSTIVVFIILSLPMTAHTLMAGLQSYAKPLDLGEIEKAAKVTGKSKPASKSAAKTDSNEAPQAIVVLGAGRYSEAPEYGYKDTVSRLGLVRLRYAAELQRRSGLPILVSGGAPNGESSTEASLMRDVLVNEFKANVKWVEDRSANTRDNARLSAELLGSVRHVYLVTHAWHMRRAVREFEQVGIRVVAAPTGFHTLSPKARSLAAYLPNSEGMSQTAVAIRERVGFLWHDLQGSDEPPRTGAPPRQPAR